MSKAHEFHAERVEKPDVAARVFRMAGVLSDTHTCYEFLDAFKEEIDGAPPRLLFNLARLEHMYSAGIGILAGCYTAAHDAGKTLILVGVPKHVHRILKVSGLLPLIREHATEEEALAAPLS